MCIINTTFILLCYFFHIIQSQTESQVISPLIHEYTSVCPHVEFKCILLYSSDFVWTNTYGATVKCKVTKILKIQKNSKRKVPYQMEKSKSYYYNWHGYATFSIAIRTVIILKSIKQNQVKTQPDQRAENSRRPPMDFQYSICTCYLYFITFKFYIKHVYANSNVLSFLAIRIKKQRRRT